MIKEQDRSIYWIWLGGKSEHAREAIDNDFIGVGFSLNFDLKRYSRKKEEFYQELQSKHQKSEHTCCMLWRIYEEMQEDDIIITRDENSEYKAGKIIDGYRYKHCYKKEGDLLHCRPVEWFDNVIPKEKIILGLWPQKLPRYSISKLKSEQQSKISPWIAEATA